MELLEGGIVYLPRGIPHSYRITSLTADLLMICTPTGIEGMFRHAGRDRVTPQPDGFKIPLSLLGEASEMFGNVIVGPPADRSRESRTTTCPASQLLRVPIQQLQPRPLGTRLP